VRAGVGALGGLTTAKGPYFEIDLSKINQMNEKLPAPCEACRGSGLRRGAVCSECQGKGYRLMINGHQIAVQQQSPQRWQLPRA